MLPEAPDREPTPAPSSPRPAETNAFEPWTTPLFTLAWLVVLLQGWGAAIDADPLSRLWDPVSAASRVANRDVQLAEADLRSPSRLRSASLEEREEAFIATLHYAIEMHEDVAQHLDARTTAEEASEEASEPEAAAEASQIRTQQVILLAAAGRLEEAVALARETSACMGFEELIAAAHDEEIEWDASRSAQAHAALTCITDLGVDEWLFEDLALRALFRSGKEPEAEPLMLAVTERGLALQSRADWTHGLNLGLMGVGLLAAAAMLVHGLRSGLPRPSGPAPWSFETGLGVVIRGDFWSRLYFVALASTPAAFQESAAGTFLHTWGTPLASIPLLWLVHRYLLEKRNPFACFGLEPRSWQPWSLLGITFAAIAIDLFGVDAIYGALATLGQGGHWAEGFDETLVWGTTAESLWQSLDLLVWAPVFEELTFRGLLYWSLRRRFGVASSMVLSAGVFSLVHFYSFPGFLATFFSGVVWTAVFERSRSLAPGIAAHSFYNLLYILGIVLMYR